MSIRVSRAMTLLEVLIAISVIGVLLGLLVPSVAVVRSRAADMKSLANLRTHAQAATLYAGDFRDFAPYIADPDATYSIARGGGVTMEFEFFESSEAWVIALVDDYYQLGLTDGWGVFAYPGPEPGIYQYSPSFIARPAFWNMETRAAGQLGPNRLSSTTFPANKAIFVEHNPRVGLPVWGTEGIFNHAQFGMALVDGSARRIPWDQLLEPVRAGEGSAYGARFSIGLAGMHTIDGVLGRDVP
jgi:prepilin-type N-terminal cleavage/methylation domain-containing protein